MHFTRRDFLSATASAIALAPVAPHVAHASQVGAKRVLVIGGGPAGLSAAYEMMAAGHDVRVFEASGRVGGRVWSLREPFDDGLVAEAGATVIGTEPVHRYIRELGLQTRPLDFSRIASAPFFVRGQYVPQIADATEWPLELNDDEQGLTRGQLWGRYRFGPIGEIAATLGDDDFPFADRSELDVISLAEFYRRQGASENAIFLMGVGTPRNEGEGIESFSALSAIAATKLLFYSAGELNPVQIVGGNDRVFSAMAERLGDRVALNTPVVAVDQDENGARVTVAGPGGQATIEGDAVICAAPYAVLPNIDFGGTLSSQRVRSIAQIQTTSITRVYFQLRERFWEAAGRHPGAQTDMMIGSLWDTLVTQDEVSDKGVLEAFTGGAAARELASLPEAEAVALAASQIELIHPGFSEYIEATRVFSWDEQPWQRGCQVYYRLGQWSRFMEAMQRPDGRIYFAGDHIGGIPGYITSAIWSAHRAAEAAARA